MDRDQNLWATWLQGLLEVGILVAVCEFIYWTTTDIVFNEMFFVYGLGFVFHAMGVLLAIGLSTAVMVLFDRLHRFLRHIMLVMINVYVVNSLFKLIFPSQCNEEITLSYLYSEKVANIHSGIVILLLIMTAYILIFKVLPRMKWEHITIVSLATFIFLVDAVYFLIGYDLFYPGNW